MGLHSLNEKQPNRLLRGLVVFSLLIHVVLFMHIAGIYRSQNLSFIELSVKDFSKPKGRTLPRPRLREKVPEVTKINKLKVVKQHVPKMKIHTVGSASSLTSPVSEQIGMPETSGLSPTITKWHPVETSPYMTREDYFGMVRMKIESRKKYPVTARKRQIEGSVEVGFIIDTDGRVSSVEVVKASPHPDLNLAALNAVKSAAPFPRLPSGLFPGQLKMTIKIMFELM